MAAKTKTLTDLQEGLKRLHECLGCGTCTWASAPELAEHGACCTYRGRPHFDDEKCYSRVAGEPIGY